MNSSSQNQMALNTRNHGHGLLNHNNNSSSRNTVTAKPSQHLSNQNLQLRLQSSSDLAVTNNCGENCQTLNDEKPSNVSKLSIQISQKLHH